MTVTEQARRSDSLFHDNVSRRELCNMIARLEADTEDLRELMRESLTCMDDLRSRARKLGVKES